MDWWKDRIQKLNKFDPRSLTQLFGKNQTASSEEPKEPDAVALLKKKVRLQAFTALASIALILVLVFSMTAAWYTNVAKTSDLTFQTETWGYDADKIQVGGITIPVAPGSEGFIPLSVDNSDSTEGVEIGVTISQLEADENWQDELRKRIYFFADTDQTFEFPSDENVQLLYEELALEAEILAEQEAALEEVDPFLEEEEPAEEETITEEDPYAEEDAVYQETVSRIYIGATEENGYSYTILPGQKLLLNETYYNDVPLKWMWVYDMLGYYFRGTVAVGDPEVENSSDKMMVEEYLRPIEFDYADAVYDSNQYELDSNGDATETRNAEYGQLQKADGLSRESFLKRLSLTDGYQGIIDPDSPVTVYNQDTRQKEYYYPVAVDENGYGVWAYLCTKDEVQDGIKLDNELATKDGGVSMTATISITAVSLPTDSEEVDSVEALNTALADDKVDVVTLTTDIELKEPLAISGETDKVIDLNLCNLTYNGTDNMFQLEDGSSMTVMNGTVQASEEGIVAFESEGAELLLSGVTLNGFKRAVEVNDSTEGVVQNSNVRLSDCVVETSDICVLVKGNGDLDRTTTKVVVENSRLSSDYVALSGQGNYENWGTEMVIIGSDVYGKWGAIYQPQGNASTVISESTLSGYTGMAVKGGKVTISNSTITGTGDWAEPKASGSGFTDTGDGVYVEAVYDWSTTVIIKGENTEITSKNAYAVDLYGEVGKGPGKVLIYDGTLVSEAEENKPGGSILWNGIGTFEIHGGSFPDAIEYPEDAPIKRYDQ